jgi:hypothetical protein
MNDIEPIIPPKLSRGRAISAGKLAAKIKRLSGVNEELLGASDSNPIYSQIPAGPGMGDLIKSYDLIEASQKEVLKHFTDLLLHKDHIEAS